MIKKLYKEESNEELFNDYKKADRFMLFVVFIHWILVSTLSALPYHTYTLGIVGGGVLYFITLFAYQFYKGTPIMRILVAIAFMTYTIISIQQNLGRIEMHFHVFIALAFLTIYKDFIPVAVASIYIALHHLLFTYLQLHNISIFGTPIMLFNYGCGWSIAFLHAFYVVFEWVVLTMIIHRSRVAFYDNIKYKSELQDANDNLEHKIQEKLQDIENQKLQLEKLMSLFDKNVIFSRTDLKGNITYANSKFRDVSGYSLEELLGKNHNIIRHPDMPDAVFKKMWDTIKDGQVYNGIIKNLRKDGSYFWVDLEIMPIKDDDKNIIGYISAARSASKQDIEENQALYQKMLEDER
jgi:PAS domain S-box-containing protein